MKRFKGERKMPSGTVIGMTIFGLLVVGALCLAIYQGAQQRRQLEAFSARHGWPVSPDPGERLSALLDQMDPKSRWNPRNVLTIQTPPGGFYFFSYQRTAVGGRSSPSNGHACLFELPGRRFDGTVEIFNRVPGIEKLYGGRQQVGSEEFRRAFTVTAEGGANAEMVVNPDVERVMLSHAEGPGWVVNVTIASGGVLVSSFWAQSEQEWDYLIDFSRRLKGAIN